MTVFKAGNLRKVSYILVLALLLTHFSGTGPAFAADPVVYNATLDCDWKELEIRGANFPEGGTVDVTKIRVIDPEALIDTYLTDAVASIRDSLDEITITLGPTDLVNLKGIDENHPVTLTLDPGWLQGYPDSSFTDIGVSVSNYPPSGQTVTSAVYYRGNGVIVVRGEGFDESDIIDPTQLTISDENGRENGSASYSLAEGDAEGKIIDDTTIRIILTEQGRTNLGSAIPDLDDSITDLSTSIQFNWGWYKDWTGKAGDSGTINLSFTVVPGVVFTDTDVDRVYYYRGAGSDTIAFNLTHMAPGLTGLKARFGVLSNTGVFTETMAVINGPVSPTISDGGTYSFSIAIANDEKNQGMPVAVELYTGENPGENPVEDPFLLIDDNGYEAYVNVFPPSGLLQEGSQTTDFAQPEINLRSLENFTVHKPGIGRIVFRQAVDIIGNLAELNSLGDNLFFDQKGSVGINNSVAFLSTVPATVYMEEMILVSEPLIRIYEVDVSGFYSQVTSDGLTDGYIDNIYYDPVSGSLSFDVVNFITDEGSVPVTVLYEAFFPVTAETPDPVVTMAAGNTGVSADNKWSLEITSGTVKAEVTESDLLISGLPAGLSATAVKGDGNTIDISVFGTADPAVNEPVAVSIVVSGSAVMEAGAYNSEEISVTVNPSAFQVTATASDGTVTMAAGNTVVSADDKWVLNITSGTVKADASVSDLTITGLPAGLNATAAKGAGNTIELTVSGTAASAISSPVSVGIVVKGSAVTDWGATDSESVTVTIYPYDDTAAPFWPPGSQITVFNVGQTGLTLTWTPASDDVGVTGYRVYKNDSIITTVGNVQTANVSGLAPGAQYTFKIEAGDAAGNWTVDGPSVTVTTAASGGDGSGSDSSNDSSPAPTAQDSGAIASGFIDPAQGGTIQAANGELKLEFPAEAIQGTNGTMVKVSANRIARAEVDTILKNTAIPEGFKFIGRAFELKAEATINGVTTAVTSFVKPVTLTVNLSAEDLKSITDPDKVGLFKLNSDRTLTFIGGKLVDGKLIVEMNGFSRYLLAEVNITFNDLAGHWAKNDVELMASKYIVKGFPGGKFEPEAGVTRAQFAVMLVNAMAVKGSGQQLNFSDVRTGDWFYDKLAAAVKAGVIKGYPDGTFRPDEPVTRQEAAVMVAQALKAKAKASSPGSGQAGLILSNYSDGGRVHGWAANDVALAVKEGIIRGKNNTTLVPAHGATRAEAAAMVARYWRK